MTEYFPDEQPFITNDVKSINFSVCILGKRSLLYNINQRSWFDANRAPNIKSTDSLEFDFSEYQCLKMYSKNVNTV